MIWHGVRVHNACQPGQHSRASAKLHLESTILQLCQVCNIALIAELNPPKPNIFNHMLKIFDIKASSDNMKTLKKPNPE